jgi:hypothetical protein
MAESVGSLPVPTLPVAGLERTSQAGINVLAEDYWNLSRALLP